MSESPARLTIVEVSKRTGLSVHTLRAWERRYGVPAPERSASRYRLYDAEDLEVLRRMVALVSGGVSPAEASKEARASLEGVPAGTSVAVLRRALLAAFSELDPDAVQRTITRALIGRGVSGFIDEVAEPVLREIGIRWAEGSMTVAVEHFASGALRARLDALTRELEVLDGEMALLACAPGERHDLPLVFVRLQLQRAGWRVTMLGADLPIPDLVSAVSDSRPRLVGLSATSADNLPALLEAAGAVRAIDTELLVAVGGQAVTADTKLPAGVLGPAALRQLLDQPGEASASA
ncbi:MAG: cobalamin-dependent protein [Candidatus Dormibacteria bacterium]